MDSKSELPMWGDVSDLLSLFDLESVSDHGYRARTYGNDGRNVIEGGHLLGQAIIAASRSVPEQAVISAHGVFSRPATFAHPVSASVELPRKGRSFSTVTVELEQAGKSCASALLLLDKGAPDLFRDQIEMPNVASPEESVPYDYRMSGREVRIVGGNYSPDPHRTGYPEICAWVRHRESADELAVRQAVLSQFAGRLTIAAAMLPHKGFGEAMAHVSLSTAVLSLTIHFHEDVTLTDWLLFQNPAVYSGHGLALGRGHVFHEDGRLVASYDVQVMVREMTKRPAESGKPLM